MKKRYRFLLTIVLVAIAFYFLWPSIKWYFLTPQADKDIAESSRNQIKVYAQEQADEVIKKLVAWGTRPRCPRSTPSSCRRQASATSTAKQAAPSTWTVRDVLAAYTSRGDLSADIEDWYRSQMFALKDLKNQTMQLGLDLRGGMYVTIRADFAALEKTNGTTLTRRPEGRQDEDHAGGPAEQDRPVRPHRSFHPHARAPTRSSSRSPAPRTPRRSAASSWARVSSRSTSWTPTRCRRSGSTQAAHPGVLLDAAGNVKDTGVLSVIPKGDVLRGVFQKDSYGLDELKGYTVLHEEVGLNGTEIKDAQVGRDPVTGQPTVNFILTGGGRRDVLQADQRQRRQGAGRCAGQQGQGAGDHPGAHPRPGARHRLHRSTEAQDLALVLRTGALPVPLEITSQQAIGASLGQDAISQGIKASALGLALVFVFMLAYYRRAGLERRAGEHPEPVLHRGHPFRVQLHADPGRNRRPRAERRHGRGRKRADLREDEGGDAAGQDPRRPW